MLRLVGEPFRIKTHPGRTLMFDDIQNPFARECFILVSCLIFLDLNMGTISWFAVSAAEVIGEDMREILVDIFAFKDFAPMLLEFSCLGFWEGGDEAVRSYYTDIDCVPLEG